MLILGVDPGNSGAYALYDGSLLWTEDMPKLRSTSRGFEINWPALNLMIDEAIDLHFCGDSIDTSYVERVGARPGQGVSSMFKFGTAYGGILGMLAAKFIPVTLVTPSVWKKHVGATADKDVSRNRASQLFPKAACMFTLKKDNGKAEAALIAKYGWDKVGYGKE